MGSFWLDRACHDINRAWILALCLEFLAAGVVVWEGTVGQLVGNGVERTGQTSGREGWGWCGGAQLHVAEGYLDLGFQERSTTQSPLSLLDTLSSGITSCFP